MYASFSALKDFVVACVPNSWTAFSDGQATIVAAWITASLTLAAIIIGLWQFFRQQKGQRKELIDQQKEANKRPFKQKQLELYFLASETVSTLATEFDREKWERARSTFWQLSWGQLSLVEDPRVESIMVEIGKTVPKSPESSSEVPIRALERSSLHFAHLMRDLIEDDWKVTLEPLPKEKGAIRPEATPQGKGPEPKSSL